MDRRVVDVFPGRWTDTESFAHYVAVVEQAVTREFEVGVDREGERVWFHCVASPMDGSVAIWFTDVTARKRDERVLQEADRRKDEFLATLAHELRNPLAPIRQAAAIAHLPHATEAQKRWSHQVIDRQVRHMALLLDDLLDVSRITRGALALRRGPNLLAAMLDAAVETARPLVDARGHALEVVAPPVPVVMQADPLRLAVDVPAEGRHQPEVVEHQRPEVERQVADLPDRTVDDPDALVEVQRGLAAAGPLGRLEADPDRRQRLADLVVELARQVPPLLLLDLD